MVLVMRKTETLIERGERRKRWMNVRLQSAAAAGALEGNNLPGTLWQRLVCIELYVA